jgi:hypothetical protein
MSVTLQRLIITFKLEGVWHAFACAIGDFLDAAAFRVVFAFDVILGSLPLEVEKRYWNRSLETPVSVDVGHWTNGRRIFSVLVWPPVESSLEDALEDYEQRVKAVRQAIARGANEMRWCICLETAYGLVWNPKREVWVASDGFAYDGQRSSG